MTQCHAKTIIGNRCLKSAKANSTFCTTHSKNQQKGGDSNINDLINLIADDFYIEDSMGISTTNVNKDQLLEHYPNKTAFEALQRFEDAVIEAIDARYPDENYSIRLLYDYMGNVVVGIEK